MAVLKCKMCGGELEIDEGLTVAKCIYCGTQQTVPKIDSEKKATLFARANRLRFNGEFDKASGLYESIVSEFPEEAEAFWGLVLCKYGIEYVDDPATAKKIPTCHRSSFNSVLEDADYEQTLENADPAARALYRSEAKNIEELRQNIVEVSSKEQPYDIFICYKETDLNGERTIDSVIAQDVYTALTEKGYRVFFSRISLEDKLGKEYEPYIFAALNSAKIMLAFGTDYEYYNAVWVKNEWSRYLKLMATDRTRTLIPCYKGIDAYDMPKEFLRLQSQDMGKVGAMQDLLRGIEKILPLKKPVEIRTEVKELKEVKTVEKVVEKVVVKGAEGGADTGSLLKRAEIFLEDGDFYSANTYAEKVLDIDPECGKAYLVKLCCDYNLTDKSNLANLSEPFVNNNNYKKILRFGSDDLKEELNGYLAQIEERIKAAEMAAKKAAEAKRKAEEQVKKYQKMISASVYHSAVLFDDGTVMAVGNNQSGQCNLSDWRDIVAVSAGIHKTVGVKSDGTAVASGGKLGADWRDLVDISIGQFGIIGLKKDGTVITQNCQKEVAGWRDIVAVSAGGRNMVGLNKDGTVVAVGDNNFGQCNVSDWRDIVAVSAGGNHTVGLKKDGTVVAVGSNEYGKCKVSEWQHIVAVRASGINTVGLKEDGTVVVTGYNPASHWRDIVAISASGSHIIGVKSDGTIVADGSNEYGQCEVDGWDLFDTTRKEEYSAKQRKADEKARKKVEEERTKVEEIHKKNEEARRKKEIEYKINKLNKEKWQLKQELAGLKGLFTGKRKKEIQARLAVIDEELDKLKQVKI